MNDWDADGWAGARRAQEDAWLSTSPEQRLAWLEEAVAFARTALVRDIEAPGPKASTTPAPRS